MSYTVFAFDKNKIDLGRIHTFLQTAVKESSRFAARSQLVLSDDGDELVLDFDGWQVVLGVNASEYVESETQELVKHLPPDEDKLEAIRGSRERLEIISDEDYDEQHYEDYLLLLEELEQIAGMVVVDPRECNYA